MNFGELIQMGPFFIIRTCLKFSKFKFQKFPLTIYITHGSAELLFQYTPCMILYTNTNSCPPKGGPGTNALNCPPIIGNWTGSKTRASYSSRSRKVRFPPGNKHDQIAG